MIVHRLVRPSVLVFDVIETLFSLEPIRHRLVDAGFPPTALDWWFAEVLRGGCSLAVLDRFEPFADVATTTLRSLVARAGIAVEESWHDEVVGEMSSLPAHPDAAPALEMAVNGGMRVLALTNGSLEVTQELFARAGLDEMVEHIVSIEESRRWKPRPEPYLRAVAVANEEPRNVALVAVHAWDIAGHATRASPPAGQAAPSAYCRAGWILTSSPGRSTQWWASCWRSAEASRSGPGADAADDVIDGGNGGQ